MSTEPEVATFFERQGGGAYADFKTLTRREDEAAARLLNAEVSGRALCIGGVWERFERGPGLVSLSALDLSGEMLRRYAPPGVTPVVGDLYEKDFPAGSFDAVVFSGVLHHVARGGWRECRDRIETALARARRWLIPGGRVFIVEYCPAPAWMPLQRLALPLTRLFLRLIGQPLVVMHERAFYEGALARAGFARVTTRPIAAPGASNWEWFPVFMGVRWLKLPLKVYPKMHLFAGLAPR